MMMSKNGPYKCPDNIRLGQFQERLCLQLTHLPLEKMVAISADDIFKCIFVNEKVQILITISLEFVPNGLIDNI